MTAVCAGCGATNKLPAAPRVRCGKCKREFTEFEVLKAALGDRPDLKMPTKTVGFTDAPEPEVACKDEDECGWEGLKDELEDDKCPECGKKVRPVGD